MINVAATLARIAAAAVLFATAGAAFAEPKYPDFSGQWVRIAVPGLPGQPSYDPTKGWGKYQQAPLTPEYQAILDANIKDQENGGHGKFLGWTCLPYGMPMMMYGFLPIELVVTPKTTYVLEGFMDALRRIYTDDRDYADVEPTWQGYSVGRWVDVDGDGTYDVLKSRPAISRARGISMKAASRSMPTTSRSSGSASISTRTIPTSCMTSSRPSITPSLLLGRWCATIAARNPTSRCGSSSCATRTIRTS